MTEKELEGNTIYFNGEQIRIEALDTQGKVLQSWTSHVFDPNSEMSGKFVIRTRKESIE